jgi:NAD(P)-dependent dehydrogenase (short-subunit alcohol dehydrogenase family)
MVMATKIFDLTGHVALVTGGNSGLGLSMAKGLAKAGANIAIWGRNAQKNAAACEQLQEIGCVAKAFECDVRDLEGCQAAFSRTLEQFERVDSCFANAGGSGVRGAFHTLSHADWQATIALNLMSVINTFQLAIQHWLQQEARGKLIVTSSIASQIGLPMSAGYSTTKASVEGLVRSLAIEYAARGIQANAILPGFIETEMSLNTPKHFQDGCKRRAASGTIGKLEDMEGVAVYLASQESNFMTGQSLILDGGHMIYPL